MSSPRGIPAPKRSPSNEFAVPCASPSHHTLHMSLPSPLPTRRTRTKSQSEVALEGPMFEGTVTSFCRERGHGWVKPDSEEGEIFLHVSDIEEEFVPRKGDRASFRKIMVPPKNVKSQAVHVKIIRAIPEAHDRWDESPRKAIPDSH